MEEINELSIRNMISSTDSADETLCRLVYAFARKLPYSMDYADPDFVLGNFINFIPDDPKKNLFVEYGCIYNKMINWGDTIVNGVKLQICNIFQQMLMTEEVDRYQLEEVDFYTYGFDKLTSMDIYNQNIFKLLSDLPKYCVLVRNASTQEERRTILKSVYEVIDKVTSYVEYHKRNKIDMVDGVEVLKEDVTKFVHRWSPAQDLEMLFHFNYLNVFDLNVTPILDSCKKQLVDGKKALN